LIFRIEEASEKRPCLGLRLNLDSALVASVMMESGIQIKKGDADTKAMNVSAVDADLLDAVVRMVRLAERPDESKVLAPLVVREIVFRLLVGGQGARLAHLLTSGGTQRISKAIGHLRAHFDEPLKMEDVARDLGMSVSGFHHHFKSVTAMSKPVLWLTAFRPLRVLRLRTEVFQGSCFYLEWRSPHRGQKLRNVWRVEWAKTFGFVFRLNLQAVCL
jgi:AraC-like DNA-binding protein